MATSDFFSIFFKLRHNPGAEGGDKSPAELLGLSKWRDSGIGFGQQKLTLLSQLTFTHRLGWIISLWSAAWFEISCLSHSPMSKDLRIKLQDKSTMERRVSDAQDNLRLELCAFSYCCCCYGISVHFFIRLYAACAVKWNRSWRNVPVSCRTVRRCWKLRKRSCGFLSRSCRTPRRL